MIAETTRGTRGVTGNFWVVITFPIPSLLKDNTTAIILRIQTLDCGRALAICHPVMLPSSNTSAVNVVADPPDRPVTAWKTFLSLVWYRKRVLHMLALERRLYCSIPPSWPLDYENHWSGIQEDRPLH